MSGRKAALQTFLIFKEATEYMNLENVLGVVVEYNMVLLTK
jgi:hypothetical protein